MTAKAYAASVSLLNTMDQIQIHPFLSTHFNINYSIESLREKVDFFADFVEKYSDAESREAEDLLRRIADVAHEAEEMINVEAAYGIRVGSSSKSRIMSRKLKKITQEMDCIKEKAMNAEEEKCSYAEDLGKEQTGFLNQQLTSSLPSSSSSAPPANAKAATMVGFDGYVEQLLGQLTGNHSGRQILPIVGMGGIGKTTLATHVYHNSLTLHHFDIRVWITVSQEFSAKKIALQALSCLGGSTSTIDTSKSDFQLGEELSKILFGRRYVIVLDDIWSVEAWEKIKFFFPENNNRSRIVITTRESELVDYFGSSALVLDFLDEKDSWKLFCKKTFAKKSCPYPELEQVGKKIVRKCKGLPLAIIVIGGLLGKSAKTQNYWEKIAQDRSLILDSGEDNKPSSILYLSYKHLPVWLKSCFLYLGLFPEDHKIKVSQLIKLWVAEGFIRSKTEQSLEEIAESYTKELVDRNLLLVGRLGLDKKLESCRVHDVVRELCIWIGEKEKYFCVQRDIDEMRHFIVDESTARLFCPQEFQEMLPSIVHPLILEGQRATRLDSSIQLLWSLQTLIVTGTFNAPREIWKMPQLRHIEVLESISLPDPPSPTCEDDVIVLQNLQTLKRVHNLVLSEEVCKRIPNIKELTIFYELFNKPWEASSCCRLHNLGCFNKLESLKLYTRFKEWEYLDGDLLQKLELPSSLKKLSLSGWKFVWSDVAMIATLPQLQFLKLENNKVVGPKWDCVEGKFLCLKHLFIYGCDDTINWSVVDNFSFPVLEIFSLASLYNLEEIPPGIGDIPTLEEMYVLDCNESVIMSAIKILEEQESLGNESLHLTLSFQNVTRARMWRGEIQQLGITCQNLHIASTQ
ncbi:hypothetical protein C2S51_006611 [Perilla frutescens var. frutescens]|nr:hypothetical protein C2S51_006611 [Perilla frutescens var. frutescens]